MTDLTDGHKLIVADVVIDVGCADWGTETSVLKLIDRFSPRILFGFDPAPGMQTLRRRGYTVKGTRVEIIHAAAWTFNGTTKMWLGDRPTVATLSERCGTGETIDVECVDLAEFITALNEQVVLKLDIEGGEYALLAHLLMTPPVTELLAHVLVEWHDHPTLGHNRALMEKQIRGLGIPLEEW